MNKHTGRKKLNTRENPDKTDQKQNLTKTGVGEEEALSISEKIPLNIYRRQS